MCERALELFRINGFIWLLSQVASASALGMFKVLAEQGRRFYEPAILDTKNSVQINLPI